MPSFLMCPPTHFDITYSINPWMQPGTRVDHALAEAQWANLRQELVDAGAAVEIIDPVQNLPDMVFAANYGIVDVTRFIPANFRHAERQPEVAAATAWFRARGYRCVSPETSSAHLEGGEVFACAGRTWVGFGMRNDEAGVRVLDGLMAGGLTPLRLVDPDFFHLDTCFCPLDDRTALVAMEAFDAPSRDRITELIPEVIALERDEARSFAANSVIVDRKILMPGCPNGLARTLEGLGYEPTVIDVSEFLKAGGGVRCMVLPIDTSFQHG